MRLLYSKYSLNNGAQKLKTKTALVLSTLVLSVSGAGGMAILTSSTAHADSTTAENGCSFVETASTWTLQADCNSAAQINLPVGVTLDGQGYTISPTFNKNASTNNYAALGISSDNVRVKNLIINGVNGQYLHGINVYRATGVVLNDVTLENNEHNGLVVNGSNVTVNNLTTSNNGWGGVDVDKGGVSKPAVLTVNGTSNQTEAGGFDIYVDNSTSSYNSVVDSNSQYVVTYNVKQAGDAVYTLKSIFKESCKSGGWQNLKDANGNSFKNQGACVSYVASNGKSQH